MLVLGLQSEALRRGHMSEDVREESHQGPREQHSRQREQNVQGSEAGVLGAQGTGQHGLSG